MAPSMPPSNSSNGAFPSNRQNHAQPPAHRTAPAIRSNLPPNSFVQPQIHTQQQLQQYHPWRRSYLQQNYPGNTSRPMTVFEPLQQRQRSDLQQNDMGNFSRPETGFEALRVQDTNYTSKPMSYRNGPMDTDVAGCPEIDTFKPMNGFPAKKAREISPRFIAPDMMEAIFLGDPGHFLGLDDGRLYYIWRRATLKNQGKSVLSGRLFPHFPIFMLNFPVAKTFEPTFQIKHGTYAFFYFCWRMQQFPPNLNRAASKGNNLGNSANAAQTSNVNEDLLSEFIIGELGSLALELEDGVPSASAELKMKNLVIKNMNLQMDLAWQSWIQPTRNTKPRKTRSDLIAEVENSIGLWTDPEERPPLGYKATPDHIRQWEHTRTLLPYVVWADKHVWGREMEIRKKLELEKERTLPTQNQSGTEKKHWALRPVTVEEVSFMDQFVDYSNCEDDDDGDWKDSDMNDENDLSSPMDEN